MLLMVVISVSEIWARSVPSSIRSVILINPYDNYDDGLLSEPYEAPASVYENHNRLRRAAYDPYSQYYYYPSSLNSEERYEAPKKNSLVNRRQAEEDLITQDGNKYKYTPLFQYKSTQSRRRKLFVPNLFG